MTLYDTQQLDELEVRIDVLDIYKVSWNPNNPKLIILINNTAYEMYNNTYNRLLKCYKYKDYNQCKDILYDVTKDKSFKSAI